MAIKDKNSIYDLSNGPVSNMSAQQGPQFQRTLEEASEKHIESLQQVPGPPSNSPFQDLNGAQGPQSQLPVEDASQRHIDSLTQEIHSHNGGPGTNHYNVGPSTLDLNGVQGPQSQLPIADASQKHIDSLTQENTYQFGNSSATVGPSNLDLNGAQGPQSQLPVRDASERHIDSLTKQIQITNQGVGIFTDPYYAGPSTLDLNGNPGPLFNRGADSTLKQDSLVNIYKSNINPGASFGAGQKGGTWPNVRPTPVGANFADLDGLTPRGYVNPDTGASF